eukprot:6143110-Pleurochrysis_carterae.AAC.1
MQKQREACAENVGCTGGVEKTGMHCFAKARLKAQAAASSHLVEEREELGMDRLARSGLVAARRAHRARDTRGQIYDLLALGGGRRLGLRHLKRLGAARHVRIPKRQHVVADAPDGVGDLLHRPGADNAVDEGDDVEHRRQRAHDGPIARGEPLGNGGTARRRLALLALELLLAQRLDQLARIDLDGALLLAHAVGGAGGLGVLPRGLEGQEPLWLVARARGGEVLAHLGHLLVDLDALARRERQVARGAVRLAPAARDAAVDQRVRRVVEPDVLGMHVRVLVEDHARVEQKLWVKEALNLPHELVRLRGGARKRQG